jgi:hypothetical protein
VGELLNTNPNAALSGTITLTAQHSGLAPVGSVQFIVLNPRSRQGF